MKTIGNILWFLLGGVFWALAEFRQAFWFKNGPKHPLGHYRRMDQCPRLPPYRGYLLHHHHRNPVWKAVFQDGPLRSLAFRKRLRQIRFTLSNRWLNRCLFNNEKATVSSYLGENGC